MKFLSSFFSLVLIPLIVVLPVRAQLPATAAAAEAMLQVRVLESSASKFLVEVTDGAAVPASGAAVAFRLPDSDLTGTFADGSHATVVYTDSNGRAQVSGIQWDRAAGIATVRITAAKGAAHAGLIFEQTIGASVTAIPAVKAVPQPGIPQPQVKTAKAEPTVIAHSGASSPVIATPPPSVSVTNASPGELPHSSKKWLVIAILAGAAGAGAAFAMKGKSAPGAAPTPSLSIGNPSISIGHP